MVTVNKSNPNHRTFPFSTNRTPASQGSTQTGVPQRRNNPVTGGCSSCGQKRKG